MADFLQNGLSKLNFSAEETAALLPKMERYIKEIILFNSAYNLTNTSDFDEIAVNHIADGVGALGAGEPHGENGRSDFVQLMNIQGTPVEEHHRRVGVGLDHRRRLFHHSISPL